MLLLLVGASALAAEARDITDQCAFRVSEGSAKKITDSSVATGWVPEGSDPEMMIRLPESGASCFQISWYKPATDYEILQYDENQNQLSSTAITSADMGFLANVYDILPDVRYISVRFHQKSQGINKIRVFGEGELPANVTKWKQPYEKCDLMVISTHMDDEWLWFGGIIPYYSTVLGMKVQVVYMADCGRLRHAEALNALARSGVDVYPVFLDLKDERIDSLNKTLEHWGGKEALTELMTELIRRFQPEVILTHDWDGEYGHNQHKLTSRCMETVIEAAADPTQCADSYAKYGAWQVKKLYRHLETKCPIEFDWHVSYPELGGRTPLQAATESMEENASQLEYYRVKDHGTYDNAKFGLSYSVVGDDTEHKDLFENISLAAEPTAEPTPEPTVEPTVEPVLSEVQPEPSDAPADALSPTAPPSAATGERGGGMPIIVPIALLILAAIGAFILLRSGSIKRRKRRRVQPKKRSSGKRAVSGAPRHASCAKAAVRPANPSSAKPAARHAARKY